MAYTKTPKSSEAQRKRWRDKSRDWRAANPEQSKERCRGWYHQNKAKVAETRRVRRLAQKEAATPGI